MGGPDNESEDEHVINKENTTPPMTPPKDTTKQPAAEVRIIRVGGVSFLLDQETVQKLNSEFLNRKIAATDIIKSSPSVQQQQQRSAEVAFENATLCKIWSTVTDCIPKCDDFFHKW